MGEAKSTLYTLTATTKNGGTITPLGQTEILAGDDQLYTISADTGKSINNVTVDGVNLYSKDFSFERQEIQNSGDSNEKIAVVDGVRYIICTNFDPSTGVYGQSSVRIYNATSTWKKNTLVATSSFQCGDIYTSECSGNLNFPHKIVGCGGTDKSINSMGVVFCYDISTNNWQYTITNNTDMITNLFNPAGETVLLQTANFAYVQGFYLTNVANLFESASWSWKQAPMPAWGDSRIAFFNGKVFCLQNCYSNYTWAVYAYDLGSSSWSGALISNSSEIARNFTGGTFPYISASSKMILFTANWQIGNTNYWRLYCSTDGSTFKVVGNYEAIGNFSATDDGGQEMHSWARDIGNNKLLFANTHDNDPNGYMAIISLTTGQIIAFGGNYTTHCTEMTVIQDGNRYITGMEECAFTYPMTYPSGLKIISLATPSILTHTFYNIKEPHTISATFRTNIEISHDAHSITIIGEAPLSGAINAVCGENLVVDFIANKGYHISRVIVDGFPVDTTSPYTFFSISKPHTLEVKSEADAFAIV